MLVKLNPGRRSVAAFNILLFIFSNQIIQKVFGEYKKLVCLPWGILFLASSLLLNLGKSMEPSKLKLGRPKSSFRTVKQGTLNRQSVVIRMMSTHLSVFFQLMKKKETLSSSWYVFVATNSWYVLYSLPIFLTWRIKKLALKKLVIWSEFIRLRYRTRRM